MWLPKGPARSWLFLLFWAAAVHAQNRGQADLSIQGYYLGGTGQKLTQTSGLALKFQNLLPGHGVLNGSFEGYGTQSRFQTGENFLEFRGVPWLGRHWSFTGGDFRMPAAFVAFPFYNIFTPEISARGVRVQSVHASTAYNFFAGEATMSAGPRVPYRILVPQFVAGATAVHRFGKKFTLGGRYMQFFSSSQAIADNPYLFPVGREIGRVQTAAVHSLYTPRKGLTLYGEASRPAAKGANQIVSALGGVVWESSLFTLRANYARQGTLYLPLAGLYTGDRQGPFGEARFRPWKWLDIHGSASRYENNLERNPDVSSLRGTNTSGGVSMQLPAKFSVSGQLSTIRLLSRTPGEENTASNNRQVSVSLARSIGNHALRVDWRDLRLDMASSPQHQRAAEVADVVQLRRLFLGASVRAQQSEGIERRNTIFGRGSAHLRAGRLSLFANVEIGNDLVNQTVFATNTYSTTVVGVAVRLFRRWQLQTEVFSNRLNMELNPERIFVLQSSGAPVSEALALVSQRSVYFRLTKQVRWGGGMPAETMDHLVATTAPIAGAIEGFVRTRLLAGPAAPAPGIPVLLDGQRSAVTSADGRYSFPGVPEGVHEVTLSATELPADYDPGGVTKVRVVIQSRRMARADFEVLPLASVEGDVAGSEGAPLDGILIRLLPTGRYTSTDAKGHFAFFNVHEGNYELSLDPKSLPEHSDPRSDVKVPVSVRIGQPLPSIGFTFAVKPPQKPVQKLFL